MKMVAQLVIRLLRLAAQTSVDTRSRMLASCYAASATLTASLTEESRIIGVSNSQLFHGTVTPLHTRPGYPAKREILKCFVSFRVPTTEPEPKRVPLSSAHGQTPRPNLSASRQGRRAFCPSLPSPDNENNARHSVPNQPSRSPITPYCPLPSAPWRVKANAGHSH